MRPSPSATMYPESPGAIREHRRLVVVVVVDSPFASSRTNEKTSRRASDGDVGSVAGLIELATGLGSRRVEPGRL